MAKKADLQKQAAELGIELKHKDGKDLTIPELEGAIDVQKQKNSKASNFEDDEKFDKEGLDKKIEEESNEEEKQSGYPKYKRPTKTIQAVRILCIKRKGNSFSLELEGDFEDVSVDGSYIAKYNPKPNGYFVTCEKGCKKYLSEKEFEEYNAIENEK